MSAEMASSSAPQAVFTPLHSIVRPIPHAAARPSSPSKAAPIGDQIPTRDDSKLSLGIQFVARLIDIKEDTQVTAIESHRNDVFVGFGHGVIQKLRVLLNSDGSIGTSEEGSTGVIAKGKIKQLCHSPTEPLLFVLCRRAVTVWHTGTLQRLSVICDGVGALCVSIRPPTEAPAPGKAEQPKSIASTRDVKGHEPVQDCDIAGEHSVASASHHGHDLDTEQRSVRSETLEESVDLASPLHLQHALSTSASPRSSFATPPKAKTAASPVSGKPSGKVPGSPRAGPAPTKASDLHRVHRLCCSLKREPRVLVFEYTAATKPAPENKPLAQREYLTGGGTVQRIGDGFLLPQRVLSITEYNGHMCLGMHREYSVINLRDGDSKSILSLDGVPLISRHDADAYLRIDRVLFAVNIRSMPQQNTTVLRKTIQTDMQPQAVTVRNGILLSFTLKYCDVHGLYDEEVVQRLPVSDAVAVSHADFAGRIFCATRRTVFLLQQYPLREQLLNLVNRYRVAEAEDLLQQYAPSEQRALLPTLKVMAGFAHLRHAAAAQAMGYFHALIDVREVLRYIPHLIPRKTRYGSKPPESVVQLLRSALSKPHLLPDDMQDTTEVPDAVDTLVEELLKGEESEEEHRLFWLPFAKHTLHDPKLLQLFPAEEAQALEVPPSLEVEWAMTWKEYPSPPAVAAASAAAQASTLALQQELIAGAQKGGRGAQDTTPQTQQSQQRFAQLQDAEVEVERRFVEDQHRAMSLPEFVRHAYGALFSSLSLWLDSRRQQHTDQEEPVSPANSDKERHLRWGGLRASEFALLQLHLNTRRLAEAAELIRSSKALRVADCAELLCLRKDYRLLALLCEVRGHDEAADCIKRAQLTPERHVEHIPRSKGLRLLAPECVEALLAASGMCRSEHVDDTASVTSGLFIAATSLGIGAIREALLDTQPSQLNARAFDGGNTTLLNAVILGAAAGEAHLHHEALSTPLSAAPRKRSQVLRDAGQCLHALVGMGADPTTPDSEDAITPAELILRLQLSGRFSPYEACALIGAMCSAASRPVQDRISLFRGDPPVMRSAVYCPGGAARLGL